MEITEAKNFFVSEVEKLPGVKAIGQTSQDKEKLVPGHSDIDMFVLCTKIPSYEERNSCYRNHEAFCDEISMEVCNGGVWGVGDILVIDGVDTMFMYFTIKEMKDYLEELLDGKHLEKEGGFYPIGRLATIDKITILTEKDQELSKLKEMVKEYPKQLAKDNYRFHQWQILDDEDLGRTLLHKDILFYHMVLESALDHFAQALYALNYTYFPSRKRMKRYIKSFQRAPKDCYQRLVQITVDSVNEETIERSVTELQKLAKELFVLGEKEFGID